MKKTSEQNNEVEEAVVSKSESQSEEVTQPTSQPVQEETAVEANTEQAVEPEPVSEKKAETQNEQTTNEETPTTRGRTPRRGRGKPAVKESVSAEPVVLPQAILDQQEQQKVERLQRAAEAKPKRSKSRVKNDPRLALHESNATSEETSETE